MSKIILSKLDYTRIKKCITDAQQAKSITAIEANKLLKELDSAKIVDPEAIPNNIVTMNSVVKIIFPNNPNPVQFQIVYPDQANLKENKISIFSPIATALIGYKKGTQIEWIVPGGITRIKIAEIIYQPEAAGCFDL